MIKFNPRKSKKLSFGYQAENVDPNNLEYYIRLSDGKIDYGIKGEKSGKELVFQIPPLNEFAEKNIDELNTIKMEVHDKSNKYYLKPFEDSVEIEKEPEVDVNFNEEEQETKQSTFFVTEMSEEEEEDPQVNEEETKEDVVEEVKSEVKEEKQEKAEDEVKEEKEEDKKQRKNRKLLDFLNQ